MPPTKIASEAPPVSPPSETAGLALIIVVLLLLSIAVALSG